MTTVIVLLALACAPNFLWEQRNKATPAKDWDAVRHWDEVVHGLSLKGPIRNTPTAFARDAYTILKWYVPGRILDCFAGSGWFMDSYFAVRLPAWIDALILLGFAGCVAVCVVGSRQTDVLVGTILLTGCMLLLFPGGGAPRYWLSLYPLMLILMARAAEIGVYGVSAGRHATANPFPAKSDAADKLPTSTTWVGIFASCMISAVALAILVFDHSRRLPQYGRAWEAFVAISQAAAEKDCGAGVIVSHNTLASQFISRKQMIASNEAILELQPPNAAPVYAVVAKQPAISEHGRNYVRLVGGKNVNIDELPGRREVVAENEYYWLVRLHRK